MRVKNRLSPYPILFDYRDDYIDSSFRADISAEEHFNDVIITVTYHLSDAIIGDLVRNKKAKFVLHVECPSMSLRRNFETFDTEDQQLLNMDEIGEKLEICTFIVANDKIPAYTNPHFHSDYQGLNFHLSKGQLLAIGTSKEYDIEKSGDSLATLPSIIKITKNVSKTKGTITVNTDDSNHISIGLNEEAFDLYARLGRHTFTKTALSLVLLPAMMTVLDRIREAPDAFSDTHWYAVIADLLERNGYSVEQLSVDDGDSSVLSIAQAIFSNPVQGSLSELEVLSEGVQ